MSPTNQPEFAAADPQLGVSHTNDRASFAYETVRERWPKIIQNAIQEIDTTIEQNHDLSDDDRTAGSRIKSQLQNLEKDMAGDVKFTPVVDDGAADVAGYNSELAALSSPSWQNAPWLFAECYMYRVMHTFFSLSTPFWKAFDVFQESKERSLSGSKKGTIELVERFLSMRKAIYNRKEVDPATEKTVFEEMVQICLWGNATDLSLLTTFTMDSLTSRQGKAARDASKENVLIDDTEQVWKLLSGLKESKTTGEIHVVMDNAGFELLTDLVLIGYLLEDGYAKTVTIHGKRIPWFVSDVNEHDIHDLITAFTTSSVWHDTDSHQKAQLKEAGEYWQQLLQSGKLKYQAHEFWTSQHAFGRMPVVAPELFKQLAEADLVVFKGDLNYRKLTYDCLWPKTTPFEEALGPLAKKHDGRAIRTLALRTSKADVFVGLKPGQEEALEEGWTRTGKYGLVEFWDGKA